MPFAKCYSGNTNMTNEQDGAGVERLEKYISESTADVRKNKNEDIQYAELQIGHSVLVFNNDKVPTWEIETELRDDMMVVENDKTIYERTDEISKHCAVRILNSYGPLSYVA